MTEEERKEFEFLVEDALKEQQVLLGVVGVDVPVLRLISKVSPKFQMGVGIYIIMLDNNGFIVFHPSIKRELTNAAVDSKGTSQSIDLEKFEIPINNSDEFENLEHEMIDEATNNKTLENWKREGLRVTRRKTEYVYTSVDNSPFSVAIASPNSFGRYYIDLPPEKESDYTDQINKLIKDNIYDTQIAVYNCTYNFTKLTQKITNPTVYSDFCIRYLFEDTSQVLAIKSDLVLHDIYYNIFNFSIFSTHPNLVRSSFYGTFSGITFYMPVKIYRSPPPLQTFYVPIKPAKAKTKSPKTTRKVTTSTDFTIHGLTEPLSEMTINAELASPFWQWPGTKKKYASKEPTKAEIVASISFNNSALPLNENMSNDTYFESKNLFSSEGAKHTYSFEKEYYTRSIEFSDYLRTVYNQTEPVVIYFLNETSDVATRRDTVAATLPIWLDKVPTAVTGVVYDAKLLQQILFENFMLPDCTHHTCKNLCSEQRAMNVTCYLVDEHGIVVLSTMQRLLPKFFKERETPMGQPLYKVNPWLMKQLEYDGVYELVIPGPTLQECRQPSTQFNSANGLIGLVQLIILNVFNLFSYFLQQLVLMFSIGFIVEVTMPNYLIQPTNAQILRNPTLADRIEIFNNEWRIKNSHCYYFGIYSFNISKWKELDSSEYKTWCNSTSGAHLGLGPHPRRYLAGYVKHSNLLMLVVEDEFELIHCGNMSQIINKHTKPQAGDNNNDNLNNITNTTSNFTIETISDAQSRIELKKKEEEKDFGIIKISDFSDMYEIGEDEIGNFSNSTQISIYNRKNDFMINRYRRRPDHCHNIFPNEKEFLPCSYAISMHTEIFNYVLIFIFLTLYHRMFL